MSITFERALEIRCPVDAVWEFLTDPHRIAECMPGAHLLEIVDGSFTGTVDLSLGPIGTTLAGEAGFERLDPAAHTVMMAASAQEIGHDGGAELRMRSELSEVASAATRVDVQLGVRLSGRLAGPIVRQVLAGAAEILFRRFFGCVTRRLEEV